MTLFVWKIQHSPPKESAITAIAERMVPGGSLLIAESPFVISRIEARNGVRKGVAGRIMESPFCIREKRIKYPQSLIKIKKLSMIQTSIN